MFGEDANGIRLGNIPRIVASLTFVVITAFRLLGKINTTETTRANYAERNLILDYLKGEAGHKSTAYQPWRLDFQLFMVPPYRLALGDSLRCFQDSGEALQRSAASRLTAFSTRGSFA